MSITDELRGFADDWDWLDPKAGEYPRKLRAIADRIDAEHQRECKEHYACGAEHGIGTSIDASMIQTHGYIELPKDADGEYIHVGDVMEWPDGKTFEVVGIGDGTLFYVEGDDDALADWTGASTKRHHHAPTVEDVLREMLYKAHIYDEREMELLPDLIADYAKRLTLAEGEDA